MPKPDHEYEDDAKQLAWSAFCHGWGRRGGTDAEPKDERLARPIFERWWELNEPA